jgi:hypothetical protein
VHLLGGADDGVGRADLAAAAAADAQLLGDDAIFGPSSDKPDRSTSMPSLAAIAEASALPPGGQQAGEAEPSAIAVAAPEQPGETALAAVGAGHHGQQFFHDGVAFNLQEAVGDTEDDAEDGTEKGKAEDGGDHGSSPLNVRPEKPMNARASRLMVINEIGAPAKAPGTGPAQCVRADRRK